MLGPPCCSHPPPPLCPAAAGLRGQKKELPRLGHQVGSVQGNICVQGAGDGSRQPQEGTFPSAGWEAEEGEGSGLEKGAPQHAGSSPKSRFSPWPCDRPIPEDAHKGIFP